MTLALSWTDECFLFLLLYGVIILGNSLRQLHVRQAYRDIIQKPIALSALIVLLLFLTIS